MADKFDRDRFEYELAQELGIDRARRARGPRDSVADGLQRTFERGPAEGTAAAPNLTQGRPGPQPVTPTLSSERNPYASDPVRSAIAAENAEDDGQG
jgi:hypothetical protein